MDIKQKASKETKIKHESGKMPECLHMFKVGPLEHVSNIEMNGEQRVVRDRASLVNYIESLMNGPKNSDMRVWFT